MTVTLNVNGTNYFYPETGDTNWGPEATDWASAVTTGMLQKAGGAFTLLAEVDFGVTYGLKSAYYKSRGTNIADAGVLRLARADVLSWRNQANDANLDLSVNSSNNLLFNGVPIGTIVTVSDTNSIDLTITTTDLTADLKLSAASATALNQLVTLSIQSDGLKAEIPNASIIAAIPNASTSVTGLLTNTDWNTFNGKQAAGNYITALTGDVTASGPGSVAATIAAGAVTLAKMANLAANSIIGNNTGSPATPLALTGAQTTALLSNFVGDSGSGGTKGLVPAPATGEALRFLRGDGTWQFTPSGPGTATPTATGLVTSFTPVIQSAVKAASASYTVLDTDGFDTILVTAGASTRTITLPLAANNTGRKLYISKVDSGAGTVIVDGAGSETIDGALTNTLTAQYSYVTIVCDGTAWFVLSAYDIVTAYNNNAQSTIIGSNFNYNISPALTPLTVNPGVWRCRGWAATQYTTGCTSIQRVDLLWGTSSGDNQTGANDYEKYRMIQPTAVANTYFHFFTPIFNRTLTTATDFYLKYLSIHSGTNPVNDFGYMEAVRIR